MEFKFEFFKESNTNNPETDEKSSISGSYLKPAQEIFPEKDLPSDTIGVIELCNKKLTLKKYIKQLLDTTSSEEEKKFNEVLKASDVVSGVYEGGFKLWECALDLVSYLFEESVPLNNCRVLEIGCGHGLPGIYALREGASVDFQDYNEEVLKYITYPNILLNLKHKNNAKYYSGDWTPLNELLGSTKYDFMFTSDTIYNPNYHERLYRLMKDHIQPNGRIFVAAKSYYFGLGGGLLDFLALVTKDNYFQVKRVKQFNDGYSNVREIVELTPLKQ